MERSEVSETIRRWCAAHPGSVLFGPGPGPSEATLFDVFSGKSLAFDPGTVTSLEERQNRETGGSYLSIGFDDGRALALAGPGLAFAPDPRNSGPLASLPSAVCLRDFAAVTGKLRHILDAHRDEGVTREELDMAMFCIALLDGARAIGLEVSREEATVEALLTRLEKPAV
ncbi:MAG: hypothetical protein ACYCWW_11635 [Deltaproteobacteria bacterium]